MVTAAWPWSRILYLLREDIHVAGPVERVLIHLIYLVVPCLLNECPTVGLWQAVLVFSILFT